MPRLGLQLLEVVGFGDLRNLPRFPRAVDARLVRADVGRDVVHGLLNVSVTPQEVVKRMGDPALVQTMKHMDARRLDIGVDDTDARPARRALRD